MGGERPFGGRDVDGGCRTKSAGGRCEVEFRGVGQPAEVYLASVMGGDAPKDRVSVLSAMRWSWLNGLPEGISWQNSDDYLGPTRGTAIISMTQARSERPTLDTTTAVAAGGRAGS